MAISSSINNIRDNTRITLPSTASLAGSATDDHVKIGVLLGSLIAALLAGVVLRVRNAHYRRLCAEEERDDYNDGIPDCYQDRS